MFEAFRPSSMIMAVMKGISISRKTSPQVRPMVI